MKPKSARGSLLPQARGLAGRIYLAFLLAAVVPTSIAGAIGIFYSLETLKDETLAHLRHEVTGRSDALGRFFDQLSSELLYLARSPSLADLVAAAGADREPKRHLIERDFAAFAKAYPHIYQIRHLDAHGREVVRIDRRGGEIAVVAEHDLQDKSGRYYVHEILALRAGEIYVSPLDLNVEGEEPENPEIPVIRFGTPVADASGAIRGLLIINLYAEIMLGQIQQMADMRGGIAYLFNRSGFYLARSAADPAHPRFAMNSVESLADVYPRSVLGRILAGDGGTEVAGDWILAFAPVTIATAGEPREWVIALAFPRKRLLEAVFNLYILYAVLAVSLAVTALAGFLLSTHLLRPLMLLKEEVAEIARGNFSRRLAIRGHDEIAELGRQFNMMAGELQQYYASLAHRQQVLESEVRARTAALDHERGQLATIIHNTADGILSLSPEGRIELANAAARRLFAPDGRSVVGETIGTFWPAWNKQAGEAGEAASRLHDLHLYGRILALSVAPVLRGHVREGYILVVRDMSEERRLQDERRELDRQIFQMEKMATMGELAMGLAHEIGNPLTGMKMVVQALLEDDGEPGRRRRYLARLENEVDRLASFLRTFQGFAAPQEMHPTACVLGEILEDILLWTRKEATSKGVVIDYRTCGTTPPPLWADPNHLKQVLLNLVINALHATGGGGAITIAMCGPLRAEDRDRDIPRMRFCVEDSGAGIAADILPRIFDPFFTTRADGSGLGLAVVKKIAVQHGADIHVESTSGEGTRFQLVWPIALGGTDAWTPTDPLPACAQGGADA